MSLDFILNKINDLATREQLVEICKELYSQCKNLENKIEKIEGWKTRSEQYEEFKILETNAVIIKHKVNGRYYCPVCFENNKSIISLQPYGNQSNCPSCKAYYKTKIESDPNLQSYAITD